MMKLELIVKRTDGRAETKYYNDDRVGRRSADKAALALTWLPHTRYVTVKRVRRFAG